MFKGIIVIKEIKLFNNIIFKRFIFCIWQITARCNFKCRICKFWDENHNEDQELSIDKIKNILHKIRSLSPLMISLAGGEPLLRDDLTEIIQAVSKNHYCNIITNGWLMTRKLAGDLYDNGLQDAVVSIDYATPEKHDAQRGMQGAFSRAIRAVEYLRDFRPDESHKVRIIAVLMDDNINEIDGLLLLAKELSVSFSLTLYSDYLGKKPDLLPKRPVTDYLIELKNRYKHFDCFTKYLQQFDTSRNDGISNCTAGQRFFNINQYGEVSRCIDYNYKPAANMVTDSFKKIILSLENESLNNSCSKCWTSCRGLGDIITRGGLKTFSEIGQSRKEN